MTSRRIHLARNRNRGAWFIAWALTLALHAAAMLGLRSFASPGLPETIHRPAPVRLVFKTSAVEQRKSEEPHFFSELPPDREDVAPKHADFLSNVTSRARDPIPGGDAALPRMEGESDVPTLKIEPGGAPSRSSPSPEPASQASGSAASRAAESGAGPRTPEQAQANAGLAPSVPAKPSEAPHASAGSAEGSDLPQPEMANPQGNAPLAGDVSLNTTAWDYAPWLHRFGRQLMDRWFPPPAYAIGILKEGGWALIEVEITRAGKMLSLEVLEEQGHPSLSRAAQSALRSVAPIEPLPADFPEPTLILRLRMIYPRVRPR